MKHQSNYLPGFSRLLLACGISLFIASGFSTAIAGSDSDACALLKASDLTTLLGGTPIANSNVSACRWIASGSNKKLIVAKMNLHGKEEMAYAGARQNAQKNGGKVTDEAGLGDKAFSVVEDSGIAILMIIKHGRLLQLQYMTEATITERDLGSLRSVAKTAIAAY